MNMNFVINIKRMKKAIILSVLLIGITSGLFAQRSGLGVGVILGEPTGLSVKKWTGSKTAIDAAAAWSLTGEYIHFHADALVHSFALSVDEGQLPLYIGLGGRVLLADKPAIGVRVPVGAAYHFDAAPFDMFLELAPILDLIPDSDFDVNGAIGIRYYL